MGNLPRFGLALILGAGLAAAAAGQAAPPAKCPPPARTDNITDTYGNTVVPDPYQWLEDQKSPESPFSMTKLTLSTAYTLAVSPRRRQAPLQPRPGSGPAGDRKNFRDFGNVEQHGHAALTFGALMASKLLEFLQRIPAGNEMHGAGRRLRQRLRAGGSLRGQRSE